jgi:hypothetical protein
LYAILLSLKANIVQYTFFYISFGLCIFSFIFTFGFAACLCISIFSYVSPLFGQYLQAHIALPFCIMYQLLTRVISPCRFPSWRCAQMSRMFMSHRELYNRQSKDKGIYSLFIWWNNVGFSCSSLCPLGRVHKLQKLPWQEVCVAETLCADLLIDLVSSRTQT